VSDATPVVSRNRKVVPAGTTTSRTFGAATTDGSPASALPTPKPAAAAGDAVAPGWDAEPTAAGAALFPAGAAALASDALVAGAPAVSASAPFPDMAGVEPPQAPSHAQTAAATST
jgi:hypothetical protein